MLFRSLGQVVEMAPGRELFKKPLHPYTKALYSAALSTHARGAAFNQVIRGELPSPLNPPSGCRFHTRCPTAKPECSAREPKLVELEGGRRVQDCACVTDVSR